MSRKLKKAVQNWLLAEHAEDAEREGGDEAAERALSRVFRALPMPVPSPAFAGRTLARLGLDARAPRRPHWAYRFAVSIAMGMSGLVAVLYAPGLLSSLSWRGGTNWVVDVGAGFLAAVSHRLAASYTVWDVIARAGATATEVVATPQVLGLMFVTVCFGLATLRVLAGLVTVERSSYHA